ncbi:MAG TPA: hypothetical protein VKV04_09360 [Verrucomicrobiae bacterium]|nr:hypothetical protein [Verrucomicrobiae bacterium]
MKSNLLRIFFEWALITSVLMSVGFFVWFFIESHSARGYETQIANAQAHLQGDRNFLMSIGNDVQVYAKTNVDMQRFLAALSQPGPAPVPTRPATK